MPDTGHFGAPGPYAAPQPTQDTGGPSWFSTAMSAVGGAWGNLESRAQGFLYGSTAGERFSSLGGNVAAEQSGLTNQATNPINQGLNAAMAGASAAISRPVSTVFDATNPASKDYLNLSQAWQDSAQVSAGQAILATPIGSSGLSPWGNGRNIWTGQPAGVFGGFDPTDPQMRTAAFVDNPIGKIASGTADALVQTVGSYYLAPGVLAGQAAKPLLAVARGEKAATAARLAKEGAQVEALKPIVAATPEAGKAMAPSAFGQGLLDLWHNRDVPGFVINHPIISGAGLTSTNPMNIANALRGAQDFDEFTTIYMAARGDPVADALLQAKSRSVYEMMQEANPAQDNFNVARTKVTTVNPDGTITHDWMSTEEEAAQHKAIYDDLVTRSNFLQKVTGIQEGDRGVFRTLESKTFSPIPQINDYRNARAAQRSMAFNAGDSSAGYWASQTERPLGSAGASVRIMNWMNSAVPKGWVVTSGAGAIGSEKEVANTLRDAKADAGTTTKWMNRYIAAGTAAERQQVLHAMDSDLTTKTVVSHLPEGYTQKQYDLAHQNAVDFIKHTRLARANVMDEYVKNGGFLWDAERKQAIKVPQLESQMAQSVPMTDFAELHKALNHPDLNIGGQYLLGTKVMAEQMASVFMQFWKPAVLLRLGAMPRNVGESWIASYIFLGRFPGNPLTGAVHIATHAADKAWEASQGFRSALLDQLTPQQQMAAMLDKIKLTENAKFADEDVLGDIVHSARAEGGQPYYAQTRALGTPVTHADVQIGVASPTRSLLKSNTERVRYANLTTRATSGMLSDAELAELRTLHAKAMRTHLRAKQKEGLDVVAPRGNELTPISNVNRLSDQEILGRQTVPGRFPAEPTLFTIPRYKGLVKAANAEDNPLAAIYDSQRQADITALVAKIDAQDGAVTAVREDAQALADAHKVKERAVGGPTQISTPALSRAGLTVRGPNEGIEAEIMGRNFSADSKNQLLMHSMDTKGFMARHFDRMMHPTGGTMEYVPEGWKGGPGNQNYFNAAAHFHNNQILNSPMAMRLLGGNSPEEVANWLSSTDEGSKVLRQMAVDRKDPASVALHVKNVDHNIRAAYPSEALQAKMVQGKITSDDVASHLAHRKDLVPIMDDELLKSYPLQGGVKGFADRVVEKAFHGIWTLPEDRLARWPLYRTAYTKNVNAQLQQYETHLLSMHQDEANAFIRDRIEPAARELAMSTVNRVIYSAARRTAPANALRFISPFYQVTANRFAYYGGQFLENPQNMARLFMGWNAIGTTTDADGNRVSIINLPGFVAAHFGIEDTPRLTIQKSSLNLITNSEPWYSPGFGPIVSVPVAEFMRHNVGNVPPFIKKLVGSRGLSLGMFPNGYYGNDLGDLVLPTYLHRARSMEGQQFLNTYTQIMAIETMKYRNGTRPDPPTQDEVTGRANGLWTFRLLASIVSPVNPTLSNDVLGPLTEEYRRMQKTYGRDADAQFLAKYPDYYDFMQSVSRNQTGVLPTDQAVARFKHNDQLIASLPDPALAGLVTNKPDDQGNFDSDAYAFEYGRSIGPGSATVLRGPQTAQESYNARITSRGWGEYVKATKVRDALLAAGGFKSINDSGAFYIKTIFENAKQKIIDDTTVPDGTKNADGSFNQVSPWWHDFQQQNNALYATRADSLARILNAGPDTLAAGPTTASIARQYLALRAEVRQMLDARAATGGSANITTQDNIDLAAIWEAGKQQLSNADPNWKDISTRFFSHDDLTEVPSGV